MDLLRFSVAEFNQLFADIIHQQLQLNRLCIHGEITQIKQYQDHLYLTLSYEGSHLPCAIYSVSKKKLPFVKKGDMCDVIGECRYLKNKGQLMFSGATIIPKGSGKKNTARDNQLSRYKSLGHIEKLNIDACPKLIDKVVLITAPESAAYHDVKSIINKSPHTFDTILIPATMQGLQAPNEIIQAIHIANSLYPDIICLSRGGGAEEDFDCFFSDDVAQTILASNSPIVCGIGHKINITLSCLCANAHFETPTAMAQWLCNTSTLPILDLIQQLEQIKTKLIDECNDIEYALTTASNKAYTYIMNQQHNFQLKITALSEQLIALNPLTRLSSGFVYAETEKNKAITSVQQIKPNDIIRLRVADGNVEAKVKHVN